MNSIKVPKPEAKQEEGSEVAKPAIGRFSCHPIVKFTLGEFQFENGLLELEGEKAEEFRELLQKMPLAISSRIRELDVSAAEKLVKEMLQREPQVTLGIDSSTGDRAPAKEVGTGRLEDTGGAEGEK